MNKKIFWSLGLIALFLCLFGLNFVPAEAQKVKNLGVKAAFWDENGDMIRSDGKGVYTNGVDGIQCYITPAGELKFFVSSAKRNVIIELGEYTRAANPFRPDDATIYPTNYYSGPVGEFEFRTMSDDLYHPINLLQLEPEESSHCVVQWGAGWLRYMPTNWGGARYFLRFYYPGICAEENIYKKPYCTFLVTARDPNEDGLIEAWDFEPIMDNDVAFVYKYEDRTTTPFGWFSLPFKLTVQRLK